MPKSVLSMHWLMLIGTLAIPALSYPAQNLFREYKTRVTALAKAYPFTAPLSGEFTENQLMKFLAISQALQDIAKKPDTGADTLAVAKVKLLEKQKMSLEEYEFISRAVYNAGLELNIQATQVSLETSDKNMEGIMDSMGLSQEEKETMRKARAEHRKWWKGTTIAPAHNLDLISRHEKEINDSGGTGVSDY